MNSFLPQIKLQIFRIDSEKKKKIEKLKEFLKEYCIHKPSIKVKYVNLTRLILEDFQSRFWIKMLGKEWQFMKEEQRRYIESENIELWIYQIQ